MSCGNDQSGARRTRAAVRACRSGERSNSYTVQSENDRLVIRQSDGSVLRTGIDTRTLPSAEQQALADGITLDNAEELARLLENYSS
ncbi:MAG: BofC C-terminal domain-containing protein [Agathobaculum butyriciproducens]